MFEKIREQINFEDGHISLAEVALGAEVLALFIGAIYLLSKIPKQPSLAETFATGFAEGIAKSQKEIAEQKRQENEGK